MVTYARYGCLGSLKHIQHTHTHKQLRDSANHSYPAIYQTISINIYTYFFPKRNELYVDEKEIFSSIENILT